MTLDIRQMFWIYIVEVYKENIIHVIKMKSVFESSDIQSDLEYAFPFETKRQRFYSIRKPLENTTSSSNKEKITTKQHIHLYNVGMIMISSIAVN